MLQEESKQENEPVPPFKKAKVTRTRRPLKSVLNRVVDSYNKEEVLQVKEVANLEEFAIDIKVRAIIVKSKVLEREGLKYLIKRDQLYSLLRFALNNRYKQLIDRIKKDSITSGTLSSITITASYPRGSSKGLSIDLEDTSDFENKAFKKVFLQIKDYRRRFTRLPPKVNTAYTFIKAVKVAKVNKETTSQKEGNLRIDRLVSIATQVNSRALLLANYNRCPYNVNLGQCQKEGAIHYRLNQTLFKMQATTK